MCGRDTDVGFGPIVYVCLVQSSEVMQLGNPGHGKIGLMEELQPSKERDLLAILDKQKILIHVNPRSRSN